MTTEQSAAAAPGAATPKTDPSRLAATRPNLRILTRRGTIAALLAGSLLNLAAGISANLVFSADDYYTGESFAAAGQWALVPPALNLIAIPLMLLGIAGLLYLASGRSPVVSRLALVVTTLGMAAFFTMSASSLVLYATAVDAAPNVPAVVVNSLTGAGASPAFLIVFMTFMICNPLGIVLAIVALLRSRVVPIWAVIALIVFAISDFGLPAIPFVDWHIFFVVFAVGSAISVARTKRDIWFPTALK